MNLKSPPPVSFFMRRYGLTKISSKNIEKKLVENVFEKKSHKKFGNFSFWNFEN